MATLHASWVHGTDVSPEREGYFISKRIAGYGAIFNTQGKEWFHFAIPTPVIISGVRSALNKIFVLYRTSAPAQIEAIHVYDGGSKIIAFDNLTLTGDHSQNVDQYNSWLINPQHLMKFGLGISVLVNFGQSTTNTIPEVIFRTAGADFLT